MASLATGTTAAAGEGSAGGRNNGASESGRAPTRPRPASPVQGLTYVNGEGPRMRRLRGVLDKALERGKAEVRQTWFRKILREGRAPERLHGQVSEKKRKRKNPEELTLDDVPACRDLVSEEWVERMMQRVKERTMVSFEEVAARRQLTDKLNRLDKLVNEQPELPGAGERVPPSMAESPDALLRAERLREKTKDRDRLKAMLEREQTRLGEIKQSLEDERDLARKCTESLKQVLAKVHEAHVATLQSSE